MTSSAEKGVQYWGILAALAAAVLGAAVFVSRSVAAEQVAPVDRRVTTLEAQRTEDVKKLDEVARDVKEILRAVK